MRGPLPAPHRFRHTQREIIAGKRSFGKLFVRQGNAGNGQIGYNRSMNAAGKAERVLVIHNEKSGQGDSGLEEFVLELSHYGLTGELRALHPGVSLEELLQDASSFRAVVAAGGDGTVSAVAHALLGSEVPLLPYPAGTANLVALNLGLPTDPAELAQTLLAGQTQPIDLARLSYTDASGNAVTQGFTVAAGVGFDAQVIADSEALKPRFGVGGYVLSALANANAPVARFALQLDGEPYQAEGIGVLIANFAKMQLGLELAPGANAQDGLLEVVILKTRSAAGLVPELLRQLAEKVGLAASHVSDRLEIHSVKRVRLESDPPLPVQFDGESVDGSPPLEAWVVPERVRFIVPAAPDA